MASRTVELKLRVQYELAGRRSQVPTDAECRQVLEDLVQYATNHGLLTGETDLVVEDYRYDIQTVGID